MRNINGHSVMLQAHRGDSAQCPENTMAAFRSAVAHRFDLIELDPKFTRDNQCVILHDRTIARTGRDAEGRSADMPIAEMTLAEARAYEYGGWFGAQFAGEPLPLLEEALRFAHENHIAVKIDNVIESFTSEQTAILMDVVEKSGAADVTGRDPEAVISVSSVTRQGFDALERAVAALYPEPNAGAALLTNTRQAEAVGRALDHLRAAKDALLSGITPDVVLTEIEGAQTALGELTGRTARDDMVARIFERFCVGK